MSRRSALVAAMAAVIVLATGCSSGGGVPIMPGSPDDLAANTSDEGNHCQTHLWGDYDVYIDIPAQTATAVLNRNAMFAANVVNFLNMKPANLGFKINATPMGPDYVDVDIDVSLTHPFPGLSQYNGYDVRGVFMGDGSASMSYNPELVYPVLGTDQLMLPRPSDGVGGPDGYTRWFNRTEFNGSMPLFAYTKGKMAAPGFSGTATLCPYKYFADYLGRDDDLWTWLNDPDNQNPVGVFSAGTMNTRTYYLRFPKAKGVVFGYAVIANWGGTEPEDHPSNAPEAVALSVVDSSTVYYAGPADKGGDLRLDISVWDRDSQLSGGVMEDYRIFVESTVLTNPHEFDNADMTPTGGTDDHFTYHVEIPADNVQGTDGNEYWVIVEHHGQDYTNDFGVSNLAGTDPLAAFFRHDLVVGNQAPASIKVLSPNGGEVWEAYSHHNVTWTTSSYSGNIRLEYSKDGFAADIHEISGNTENDGAFDWIVPDDPSTTVRVRATLLDLPAVHDDSDADFTILSLPGWAVTWGGDESIETSWAFAADGSGNTYAGGYFQHSFDFDPGPAEDYHYSNGITDIYLSKFNKSGEHQWTCTWGGTGDDNIFGIAVDGAGNVYATGRFMAVTDFDPGPGVDNHISNGSGDIYVTKLDASGNYQWARTWGSMYWEEGFGAACDTGGNVYVTGHFAGTVDFDPGTGVDSHTALGFGDVFVSKFDSSGTFLWARTWGGPSGSAYHDRGAGVAVGASGDVYVTCNYVGPADFDPGLGTDNHASSGIGLSKFGSSGAFEWARTWGGYIQPYGEGVAVDGSQAIYVAGSYLGTVDFDPGPGTDSRASAGAYDIFLSKFDSSGNLQWVDTTGGTGNDAAYEVAVDSSNLVALAGFISDTVDLDPGPGNDDHTSNGDTDGFLSKFDPAGGFLWGVSWGGTGSEENMGVGFDALGYVYNVGVFTGTVDFDPGLEVDEHASNGGIDVFLSKFRPDGTK